MDVEAGVTIIVCLWIGMAVFVLSNHLRTNWLMDHMQRAEAKLSGYWEWRSTVLLTLDRLEKQLNDDVDAKSPAIEEKPSAFLSTCSHPLSVLEITRLSRLKDGWTCEAEVKCRVCGKITIFNRRLPADDGSSGKSTARRLF